MSRKNKKRRYTQAQLEKKRLEKKQAKLFALQKNITIFSLLIILVLGLVSTTFSTSIFESIDNDNAGTLVAQVRTSAQNQKDLADIRANVDLAQQAATRTYVSGEYIYLKNFVPSGWGSTTWILNNSYAYAYMWGGTAGTHSYLFELYQGTAGAAGSIYRAKVTNAGTYTNMIFTRNSATGGAFSNIWNQTGDLSLSETSNCYYGFTSGGTSRSSEIYAVPPASVTATVTNAISGSGTSSNPYIVRPNTSFSVKLSATKEDAGMEGFGWNINSSSSKASSGTSNTYTKSYSITTSGTTNTYSGYAWCYEGSTANYSSSYKKSNTIYVKALAEYTVTFKGYDGTILKEQKVNSGSAATAPTPPTRTGYTFSGWDKSFNNITANTTVTATYTANEYTVTLDGNNATSTTHTKSVTATYNSAMPAITKPTRTGYTFKGYYDAKSGGTQYYTATGASAKAWDKTTTTATLYAHWEAVEYTITYNYNYNNLVETANYTVEDCPYTLITPTRAEYTFDGWYTTSTLSASTKVTQITSSSLGNKTYYAKWVSNKLTLNVSKTAESVGDATITVKENGTVVTPDANGNYEISAQSSVDLIITRPGSEYFVKNVKVVLVDKGTQTPYSNYNTDFNKNIIASMDQAVNVTYTLALKPKVTYVNIGNPDVTTVLDYVLDGIDESTTLSADGSVYVDYNSDISTTISLNEGTGTYISALNGIDATINDTATKVVGTATSVISDINAELVLSNNSSFTLSYYENSNIDESTLKYTVNDTSYDLLTAVSLPYGVATSVSIGAPEGYYTRVYSDSNRQYPLDLSQDVQYTDGGATFDVTVTDADLVYYVDFVANPTISVNQPKYGSIYITDDDGNFYLNGDTVVGGTTLNVHVYPDNNKFSISDVYYTVNETNYALTGSDNLYLYRIFDTSTVSANIDGVDSDTDYFVSDDTQQQATTSKFTPVVFNYDITSDDYALSCSVVDTNGEAENDLIRASIANGNFTIIPTTNINDCVLVQVSSSVTDSVKYYVIRISKFANESVGQLQKIYSLNNTVPITLAGTFSGGVLSTLNYYVSEDNVSFTALPNNQSQVNDTDYSYSFNVTTSGVKYYKVTAVDTAGNTASVTSKTVVGTDLVVGTRSFYLQNSTKYDLSKYNIRICFENEAGECAWASMQSVCDEPQFYRATIPTGYENNVSIYLTDKDAHLNVKSNGAGFASICYYYVEDLSFDDSSNNVIYEMTQFSKSSGMTLQLLQ